MMQGNWIASAAQDFRADVQKYFLDAGVGPEQKMAQEHNDYIMQQQQYYKEKHYQDSVKDARLAGLHPLFALGAGMAGAGGMSGAGIGPRPRPASQAPLRGGGVSRGAERRAQESHTKQMQIADQQIRANDIELMMANSQAAVLQRELQNSPVMAQAYSAKAVEAERQKVVQDEWNRQMRIVTPPGGVDVHGPAGGSHNIPAGITPQSVVEELVGEAAEGHGIATAARMYMTDSDVARIRANIRRQVRAAIRQRLANKRRKNPSRFTRFKRWLSR